MKTSNLLCALTHSRWLGVGALVLALGLPAVGWAGIANTRHNLTGTGPGSNSATSPTAADAQEICVFCHTPHGGQSVAPLWNKFLPAPAGFTTYTSSTLDATVALTGSVSLACLSCHDGTQAMDSIINNPGYGGYDATNTFRGWTWSGTNVVNGVSTGGGIGTPGTMINGASDIVSMLGKDLSNDHPIAIPYCGSGATAGSIAGCADKDFNVPNVLSAGNKWWIDTSGGNNAVRERTDIILYARGAEPYVECGSCHDPHVEESTQYAGSGPIAGRTFLRVANTQSAVCLTCHVK